VQVLLHQHVAAIAELRVLVPHQGEIHRLAAFRVLGAVDEADHAAHVEIAEALDLVHHLDRIPQGLEQLRGQLEAQVHLFGTDVQQQVAGSRWRAAPLHAHLDERVQRRRTRAAEQAVPGAGAKTADTGQIAPRDALAHRTGQGGDIGAPVAHGLRGSGAGRQGGDDEDRATGDGVADGLGLGLALGQGGRLGHYGFHRLRSEKSPTGK